MGPLAEFGTIYMDSESKENGNDTMNDIMNCTFIDNFNCPVNHTFIDISNGTHNDTLPGSPHPFPKGMLGFTASCAFIIAVLGTFGNLLTILALTMSRKLRTCATAYVVNLAVVELLFCVFILPMSGAQYAYLGYFDKSLLSDRDCIFFTITRYTLTQVELQTIVGISLTRAIAVGCTSWYQKINTKTFTRIYIALIWLYSFFLKLPTALGIFGSYVFNKKTMECDLADDIPSKKSRFISMIVDAFIPVVLIIVLYIFIFIMVRKSSMRVSHASFRSNKSTKSTSSEVPSAGEERAEGRKGSESSIKSLKRMISDNQLTARFTRRSSSISNCIATNRRDIRLARTIFVIFMMILICSFPVTFVHAIDSDGKQPVRFLGVHILYWTQYCLNMFVYVLMNKQYRDAYIDCLARFLPSCERHKGFNFPWEAQSISSKPVQGYSTSFKTMKESTSSDPDGENAASPRQGRLSAIPELNTSSCVSDDAVFDEPEEANLTRKNTPLRKRIDNELGEPEEKEQWISKSGKHTTEPEEDEVAV